MNDFSELQQAAGQISTNFSKIVEALREGALNMKDMADKDLARGEDKVLPQAIAQKIQTDDPKISDADALKTGELVAENAKDSFTGTPAIQRDALDIRRGMETSVSRGEDVATNSPARNSSSWCKGDIA